MLLADYEQQLDVLLTQWEHRQWDLRIERFIARIAGDVDAAERAHRRKMRIWRRMYDLTERTVRSIGETVEPALGTSARRQWISRYHAVAFPQLLAPETPDVMIEWLRDQSLEDGVNETVEIIYEDYLARREPLRREAKRSMVEIRVTHSRDLPGVEIEMYNLEIGTPEALREIEQRRKELAQATNQRWRSLLAEEDRLRFDEHHDNVLKRPHVHAGARVRY